MKRFALILIALLFTGCMSMPQIKNTAVNEDIYSINVGDTKTATVGDIFFDFAHRDGAAYEFEGETEKFKCGGYGTCIATKGFTCNNCFKFDLTITLLNDKELALQYAEYTMGQTSMTGVPSGWLIKQGFNKTFTYSPKETIRFKGYEFEPSSVGNGQITYKRTK